jgi:hypothetical protein
MTLLLVFFHKYNQIMVFTLHEQILIVRSFSFLFPMFLSDAFIHYLSHFNHFTRCVFVVLIVLLVCFLVVI